MRLFTIDEAHSEKITFTVSLSLARFFSCRHTHSLSLVLSHRCPVFLSFVQLILLDYARLRLEKNQSFLTHAQPTLRKQCPVNEQMTR